MPTCSGCGHENPRDAAYCVHCGAELTVLIAAAEASEGTTDADQQTRSSAAVLLDSLRSATLGEYEIIGELGRGGMAVVYLAHDLALDRKVAIKVISPNVLWMGEGIPERFKREARTAASLSHPNIIPIYAVKESNDLLFFVMKYVKGRTLESVIGELGPLPVAMVHTILGQVGNALGYAHRQGVVHRDIKPGNIMLDEEGWAVVTDFGIAKVAEAQGLTQTGGTVGTPSYMSPEQCTGLPVTGGSDQYSLGVVAFEMLTGKKPFEAKSAMALMYKHCNSPPPSLQTAVPDCPQMLSDAVMRMLAKEPEERWPKLEDMVYAIGAVPPADSDKVRTQILTLARSREAQALVEKFQTPPSPVPRDRLSDSIALATRERGARDAHAATPTDVTPIPALRPSRASKKLIWGIPPVVVAALGIVLWAPWRSVDSPPADETTPPPVTQQPALPVTAPPAVASVELLPPVTTLIVGDTARLVANVLNNLGTLVEDQPVTWESSHPEIARVSSRGLLSALSPGRAEITASSGGQSGVAEVVVEVRAPPPTPRPAAAAPRPRVASVAITPRSGTIAVGESITLSATPRTGDGRPLTDRSVSWSSSDARVARVTTSGVVTAVAEGEATISATSEGRSGSVVITVEPVPVAAVVVAPDRATVQAGATVQLAATARDGQGSALEGRSVGWTSSDERVATVNTSGLVTGVAAGSATVTATAGAARASVSVTVTAPPTPVAPDPRPELERLVQTYAAAIQARDLEQVRRLYPNISQEQANRWSTFFNAVSDLRVAMALTSLTIDGDAGQGEADMTLDFRNGAGPSHQVSHVRMVFERRGTGWRITSVR